jgi:hypothetical protein
MRIVPLAIALALLAGAVAAKNQETRGTGRLRLIHDFTTEAIPQPAAVDARLGRDPDPSANPDKIQDAQYGDVTKYLRLKSGPLTVGVFLPGSTSTPLFTTSFPTIKKRRLTALARPMSSTDGSLTLQVLDDTDRRAGHATTNLRAIHGIPAGPDGVRVGAVGAGCLTPPLSYSDDAVVELKPGSYTLGVFAPSDTGCTGDPLPGLKQQMNLRSRTAYTAIAQVKKGNPSALQLQVFRDF